MKEVIYLRSGLPTVKSPCKNLPEVKKDYISRRDQEFFDRYIKEHRDDQALIDLIKHSWEKYSDSYRIVQGLLKEYTAIDKDTRDPIECDRKNAVWSAISTFCHSSKCLSVYSGEIGITSKFGIKRYDDCKFDVQFKDVYERQTIYPCEQVILTPKKSYYYQITIAGIDGNYDFLPMDLIEPFCDFHSDFEYSVIKAPSAPENPDDYYFENNNIARFWVEVKNDWSEVKELHSGVCHKTPVLADLHNKIKKSPVSFDVFSNEEYDGFSLDVNGEKIEISAPDTWAEE